MNDCRRTLRTLAASTALIGSLIGFARVAHAQNTPDTPEIVVGTDVTFAANDGTTENGGAGAIFATINGTATGLDVRLGDAATILKWNSFNITSGSTVNFSTMLGSAAVLNRVNAAGGKSQISGQLSSSGGNVAVWLMNPNGIAINAGGAVSTGSFVATTMDVPNADFIAGGVHNFITATNPNSDITVDGTITTTGERGIVLLAPKITTTGAFDAGTAGDVAFVTANKVKLTYTTGSPLSVELQEGTTLSGGTQVIGGTVNGRNVFFALASQDGITDSLLNVSATVTSVATSSRGVVLLAGQQSVPDANVTIAPGLATGGTAGIKISGAINANGIAGAGLWASASGTFESTGASDLKSTGDIDLFSTGAATVAGAVAADGNYTVTGSSVTLGGGAVIQKAKGAVTITSAGLILGLGSVTLQSDSDDTGGGDLTLDAGGGVDFAIGTTLKGGDATRQSDVRIRSATAGDSVKLGNIAARGLLSATGAGAFANGITRSSDLSFGNVTLTNTFQANSSGGSLTVGTVAVDGAAQGVDLDAATSLTASGNITAPGAITLDGAAIDFQDVASSGDSVTATATNLVKGNAVSGAAGVTLTGGSTDIGSAISANGNVALTANAVGGNLGAGTVTATNGKVDLTSSGTIGVTAVSAKTGLTAGAEGLLSLHSILVTAGGATVTSNNGDVTVDLVDVTGNLGIDAKEAAAATGAVTVGGNYVVRGKTVALGANPGSETQQAGGRIEVTSTGGAITGGPGLTLLSDSDADNALDGIILDSFSNIDLSGATLRARNTGGAFVGLRTGAGGTVSLGDVWAGQIGGINAAHDTISTPFQGSGDFTIGKVNAASIGIELSAGNILTGDLISSGETMLKTAGGGTIGTGSITADTIDVSADGQLTGTDYLATGTAKVAGSTIGLTSLESTGSTVDAQTTVGDLTIGTLSAKGDATVMSAGAAKITDLTSVDESILVSGTSIDVTTANARKALTLTATVGDLKLGTGTAGNKALFGAGGDLRITSKLTAGEVELTATGAAIVADVESTVSSVSIKAGSVDVTNATSKTSLILEANATTLTLGTGIAATTAKLDAVGDLIVAISLGSGGQADLTSTGGNARIGAVTTTNGALNVTATSGEITGFGSPAARADLTANGAGMSLKVRGGSLAQLGTAKGAMNVDVDAAKVDIDTATATAGFLKLNASGTSLRLGSGSSGTTSALTSVGDLTVETTLTSGGQADLTSTTGNARIGAVTTTNGALNVTATSGEITGFGLPTARADLTANGAGMSLTVRGGALAQLGTAKGALNVDVDAAKVDIDTATATAGLLKLNASGTSLRLGSGSSGTTSALTSAGDLTVETLLSSGSQADLTSTGGNARIGAVTTTNGALNVTATSGAITGFGSPAARADLTAGGAGNSLTVRGGSLAQLGTAKGALNVDVDAAKVDIDTATATAGFLKLNASGTSLRLGSGSAGTTADLKAVGDLTVETLLTSGGQADLTSTTGNARIGAVTTTNGALNVTATSGEITGFGSAAARANLTAGGTGNSLKVRGGSLAQLGIARGALNVDVDAAKVDIDAATATAGFLKLNASGTSLRLGSGSSGTTSELTSVGDLTVETLLTSGGQADLKSTTGNARIGAVTTTNGALNVTATSGEITGFGSATAHANLTAGGAGMSLKVRGGSLAQLGIARGAMNVDVDAAKVDIDTATATAGFLKLNASGTSLRLGSGSSGTTSALTSVGDLTVETLLTSGGQADLTSTGGNARIGAVTTTNGALNVTATSGEITGFGSPAARADLTANGAGMSLKVRGGSLAQLGTARGAMDVDVDAARVDIDTATATAGLLKLNASGTSLRVGSGSAGTTAALKAVGDLTVETTLTSGGQADLTSTGGNARIGAVTTTNGALNVTATSGEITGFGLPTARADLTANGAGMSLTVRGGALAQLGTAKGALNVDIAAAKVDINTATATSGLLKLNASGTSLRLGSGSSGTTSELKAVGDLTVETALTSGGQADLTSTAGNARIGSVTTTNGALNVTASSGAITGFGSAAARANLTAGGTGNSLKVLGGSLAQLGTAKGALNVEVAAAKVDIETATATAGLLKLSASGSSLRLHDGSSGTTSDLTSVGDLTVETTLTSGGKADLTSTTGNAGIGTVTSTGALTVKAATGNVTGFASGTGANLTANGTGNNVSITAGKLARLGVVTATDDSINISAANADLLGAVTASTVTIVDTGGALRVGDDIDDVADTFQLSEAEVNRINAASLVFDADTRSIVLGKLAFATTAGKTLVDFKTKAIISIERVVSGDGAGRTFRFGGTTRTNLVPSGDELASEIRIISKPTGGGRLLFGAANLELRGNRIVMGQGDFVNELTPATPLTAAEVAQRYVSNAGSPLYLPRAAYADGLVLQASTVTVRYGTFALFQNTGVPGVSSGAVIGGTATTPVLKALSLIGPGSATRSTFAMFGSINGATGKSTAVLGSNVIVTDGNTALDSRLNGCVIGSGAGCLNIIAVQPVLDLDVRQVEVITTRDFELPFDPVIGTNNEALYSSLEEAPVEDEKCPAENRPCPAE